VEATVAPMAVPFTLPPEMVAFEEESAAIVALLAFKVEPVAFVKPRVVAKRPVEVTLVAVVSCRLAVPVAVRLEVVRPPYRTREEVATLPRLVTERRVSVDAGNAWQLVPSARQTLCPFTVVPEERRAMPETKMLVEVAFWEFRFVTVPFETVAFVAKRFVEVALVKTPVEATVAPMAVPLTLPPEMVAFEEERAAIVALLALREEPVALVKPKVVAKRPVEVTFEMAAFVPFRFWMVPFVAYRLVDVALVAVRFVPVALVQVRFARFEGALPVTVRLWTVAFVKVALVAVMPPAKRVWNVPSWAYRYVVVALVERRDVTVPFEAKRLVEVVFWAVTLVAVRFVPVALVQVRFVMVADGTVRRPRRARFVPVAFTKTTEFRFERPVTVREAEVAFVKEAEVKEAEDPVRVWMAPSVAVREVVVTEEAVTPWKEEAPETKRPEAT
jgi:hypothetical protein